MKFCVVTTDEHVTLEIHFAGAPWRQRFTLIWGALRGHTSVLVSSRKVAVVEYATQPGASA